MHVVFCDVVGSTSLSAQLDPEDLRDLLQQFQLLCHEVVGRLDGYIAQFLGDGVLVYFGYPRAHEDDAQRAVRAGLEIVRAVSQRELRGHRLRVRVGIHSGLVVVGEVGVPGRRAELAVGETPNVAARVQAEALPDTVAMSEATYRLVRGFFVTEELGPRSLRGIKQTLKLYAVTGESGARNRLEASTGSLTEFVARRDEMAALSQGWREACAGRGQVVSIRGEAGVGKSRLVQAFRSTLAPGLVDVVECSCSEYLRSTAFHPIAAALERKMQLDGATTPESRVGRLESYAAHLRPSSPPAAGILADLLSMQVDAAKGLQELTPTRRRQLMMETVSSWLLAPEGDLPRLLVLEDAHWADASTVELFEGLAERLASSRVMLLVTLRPEFKAPWAVDNATVLKLRPLSPSDAVVMASHVARGKSLPPELTNRIDEWTRGVPLYIEEFTKGLLESGVLKEGGDRFELAGPLPRSIVPDTLAGPLTARIDRLGAAKPVVQLAAVLGMEVRFDMLAAISDSTEQDLEGALERLLSSELLVESKAQPGAAFHFRHALIRDAAYNSLLLTDRREIHRRVVQAMQNKFAELAESRPELLAYHAGEAGLADLAVTEWGRASKRALARAANADTLVHIDEGLRQLVKVEGAGRDKLEKELAFLIDRGPALMAVKGFAAPEVKATYQRANELCEKLGDPSRVYSVLWGLWAHQFVAGELVAARPLAEQVLEIAKAAGNPALLVPAYHALGYTLCYQGEFERALEVARAGTALFDLETERRNTLIFQFSSTIAIRQFAATSLWMLGLADQARAEAQAGVELGKALAHAPSLAYGLSASTWGVPFLLRDTEAVNAAALEAIALSGDELSLWPPLVETFRGWSIVERGDVLAGLVTMKEGFSKYRGTGGGILRTTASAILAEATWKAGDAPGALDLVSRALAEIPSTQERCYEPELHRVRGEVLATLGSAPEAEESFRAALALARGQRAKSLELRAAVAFGRFLAERGRADEGRSLLRPLHGSFTEGLDTRDLREAEALLA